MPPIGCQLPDGWPSKARLYQAGANRSPKKGEETVGQIKSAGGEARFIQTDVSREADCVRLIASTVEAYGKLDVLVNNASMLPAVSRNVTWRLTSQPDGT